jgi:hypothetical protein
MVTASGTVRLLPRRLCRAVGHHRSRRRVYLDLAERRWRSYCLHCGAALKKDGLLGWREVPAEPDSGPS